MQAKKHIAWSVATTPHPNPSSLPTPTMYLSDSHKSRPPPPPPPAIDFYKDHHHHHHVDVDAEVDLDRDMMIEVVTSSSDPLPPHHPLVIAAPGDSGSGGDDPDPHASACGVRSSPSSSAVAPKKRAETWVQDETRSLISLRRDMDSLFNTSKSNKHLWEQISSKMREKGFDRSPTMCTDKWRNLLKEFKKAKQHNNNASASNGGAAKMSYYKEIDEILRERSRHTTSSYKSPNNTLPSTSPVASAKVDSFMQFSDNKGIEDTSIPYGPIEANDRQTLNLERTLDHDGHPLAITAADTVGANGVPSSIWRDGNGDETQSFVGRVITVKWVAYTRRIGIDGTADAISHAIKSAFGIRTKRAFWLEDEDQIVRSLDRDMPLGNYTLHLDEGVTIKVCHCDESGHISLQNTEEKTFYSDDDLREYLHRRGWLALKELQGYRSVDHLDDLRCDGLYRGVT